MDENGIYRKHNVLSENFFYHKYPRYMEIQAYLKMISRKYPDKIRVEKIGKSYQGRSIDMVVMQRKTSTPKNGVMIEGGIHAREWLTHTTALYVIDYVIKNPEMLEYMDFYVIPCINPDGYEYTHTENRLWRKNMNPNGSGNRKDWGVDLNRNFPYGFGLKGSSATPSSHMYRGEYSLSEPETKALARTLKKYGKYLKLYIAIHTYGNLIMYPWGFTVKSLPDESDLLDCAVYAQTAMKEAYSESHFRVGGLAKKTCGSLDYVRGIHKIKFSFTIELLKAGNSGFTASPNKILQVAEEALIGIKAMVKYVHRFFRVKTEFH